MTKQAEAETSAERNLNGSQNGLAPSLAGLSGKRVPEFDGISFRKTCNESLQGLRNDFAKIDHRWNNRLRVDEVFSLDQYLAGRFALVTYFRWLTGDANHASDPESSSDVAPNFVAFAHCGVDDHPVTNGRNGSSDEQVVLLPVVQIVEGAKRSIPSVAKVLVGTKIIYKKPFRLTEGGLYRRVSDGAYESLPIVRDGQGVLSFEPLSAHKPHPRTIKRAPEISHNVSGKEGNGGVQATFDARHDICEVGLRIELWPNGARLGFAPSFNRRIEVVDQYAGPFNL